MSFLDAAPGSPGAQRMYDGDVADRGYVMNLSTVWAHHPEAHEALVAMLGEVAQRGGLSMRERGILVSACASTLGDSYCSLAWGARLAQEAGADVAAGVLTGSDEGLTDAERALASWARSVTADPNAITADDVEALRAAGLDDARIFAVTAFVALRQAFSTVNDALGAVPDAQLRDDAPPAVREAVTWGR